MKKTWDYSALAQYFDKRPPYDSRIITRCLKRTGVKAGMKACDIGAGTGILARLLLDYGLKLVAIEPEPAMRDIGIKRTSSFSDVEWLHGYGEDTGQPDNEFDLVTFGSSFNVVDRHRALTETGRILKPAGWFICLWNHRDLEDALQAKIEQIIKDALPNYSYGVRRQDQTAILRESGIFKGVWRMDGKMTHRMRTEDIIEAWQSHATLKRQAGHQFPALIAQIEDLLQSTGHDSHEIPYRTRLWLAKLKG